MYRSDALDISRISTTERKILRNKKIKIEKPTSQLTNKGTIFLFFQNIRAKKTYTRLYA